MLCGPMPRDLLLLGHQQTSDRYCGATCPQLGMSPMSRYRHYVGRGRDPARRLCGALRHHCRAPFAELHDAKVCKASNPYGPVSVSISAHAVRPQSLQSSYRPGPCDDQQRVSHADAREPLAGRDAVAYQPRAVVLPPTAHSSRVYGAHTKVQWRFFRTNESTVVLSKNRWRIAC